MPLSKTISIIIPCLNEEENIIRCLNSIISSNYPLKLIKVIIVDGNSTDRTLTLINQFKLKNQVDITVLTNQLRQQNISLNIGIRHSNSDVILRLDTHATIHKDYITQSVKYLYEINPTADAVGCPIETKPIKSTTIGRSIGIVMSCKFGVGNSKFRTSNIINNKYEKVDTIPFGCYKSEVFKEVGLYNDKLHCSEDLDFHKRMSELNKKIYLNSQIKNIYYNRYKVKEFIKHSFRNGKWSILPLTITKGYIISIRHLIPLLFVLSISSFSVLYATHNLFKYILLFEISAYLFLSLTLSVYYALKHNRCIFMITLPIVYILLHLSYGLGSISVLHKLLKDNK